MRENAQSVGARTDSRPSHSSLSDSFVNAFFIRLHKVNHEWVNSVTPAKQEDRKQHYRGNPQKPCDDVADGAAFVVKESPLQAVHIHLWGLKEQSGCRIAAQSAAKQ